MKKFMKTLLAGALALSVTMGLAACNGGGTTPTTAAPAPTDGTTAAAPTDGGSDSGLIKVGIINNDPNESGYRTANDRDMKNTFTEANGYEASFYYSLKNEESYFAKSVPL